MSQTGVVLVTLANGARVVLARRPRRPHAHRRLGGPAGEPGQVVIDEAGRTAWVTLPALGQVALLEVDPADEDGRTWVLAGTFDAGSFPTFLAADPTRQRLLVSAQGQAPDVEGDQGLGTILLFDTSVWPPDPDRRARSRQACPTGALFDPESGSAYVLENGPDTLAWITFPEGGEPGGGARVAAVRRRDPAAQSRGPGAHARAAAR